MNYRKQLRDAGRDAERARDRLRAAEEQRDYWIRQAYRHARLPARLIAGDVGISPQRVGQIVSGSSDPRLKLHEAIARALASSKGRWVSAADVRDEIVRRDLYLRADGGFPTVAQIRSRARKYSDQFEASSDGSGCIRVHRLPE